MKKIALLFACCWLTLLAGCSAPAKARFFWPLPPDEPRLEFLGAYNSANGLNRSGLAVLSTVVTGGDIAPLWQPFALASDGKGKIYVSETKGNRVRVFDFTKGVYEDYRATGFDLPYGLTVDKAGNLYVIEQVKATVSVLNPERQLLFTFGQGDLGRPVRVAVDDARGRIYVSDGKDHQVKVFDLKGKLIQTLGGAAGERSGLPGEFNVPNGLAIDKDGNLYVGDQLNCRIQIFDPNGTYLRSFGTRGASDSQFESPMGMAIDKNGLLWIVDIRKAALFTYDLNGTLLMSTRGPKASGGDFSFSTPVDVAVDDELRIYVLSNVNPRVTVLQYLHDDYLKTHPVPADWLTRDDVLKIWYEDSGMNYDVEKARGGEKGKTGETEVAFPIKN